MVVINDLKATLVELALASTTATNDISTLATNLPNVPLATIAEISM